MKRSDVCLLSESYEAVKVNQLIKTLLEQGKSQEEIHDILVKEGFWDSAKNFAKGAVGGALGLKPNQVTASGIGKKIGTGVGNLLGTNQPTAPQSTAQKNVPAAEEEEEDTTPADSGTLEIDDRKLQVLSNQLARTFTGIGKGADIFAKLKPLLANMNKSGSFK